MATEIQRVPPHNHSNDAQGGILPAATAVGGGVPVVLRSGTWTSVTGSSVTTADPAHGVNTLRVVPLPVPLARTLDGIAFEVTAAGEAGSVVRLGIYADNGNGIPGALVAELGTVSGLEVVGVKSATPSVVLPAGVYWIGGVLQNVTTTQPTLRSDAPAAVWLGQTSLPGANQKMGAYYMSNVSGALPATFTATPTTAGGALRMFIHVA